jgi:hypothetical protein
VNLSGTRSERLRRSGDHEATHLQTAAGAAWCRRRIVALGEHERDALENPILCDIERNRGAVNVVAPVHDLEAERNWAGDRVSGTWGQLQEEWKCLDGDVAAARIRSGYDDNGCRLALEGGRGRLRLVARQTRVGWLHGTEIANAVQDGCEIGRESRDT